MFLLLPTGHMIPIDKPKAARKMVDMIMSRHAKVSSSQAPTTGALAQRGTSNLS